VQQYFFTLEIMTLLKLVAMNNYTWNNISSIEEYHSSYKTLQKVPKGHLKLNTTNELWLFLDLETTGLSKQTDDITQCCIRFVNRKDEHLRELETYTTYVHTKKIIPPFIQKLTNISQHNVETAPTFEEVYQQLSERIDKYCTTYNICHCFWVAHNGFKFDFLFWARYILGLKNSSTDASLFSNAKRRFWMVDTYIMAQRLKKNGMEFSNLKLSTLYTTLTGKLLEGHHQANVDVDAMYEIWCHSKMQEICYLDISYDIYFWENIKNISPQNISIHCATTSDCVAVADSQKT
jgi:DNA polymerase III alpha subunit (gram-positive type)